MPRIMAIDRFYMERLYEGGEVYDIGDETLQMMKDKGMSHHIQRLDAVDEEIVDATDAELDKLTMAKLREIAEELKVDHEGLKKAALINAIQAAQAAKV